MKTIIQIQHRNLSSALRIQCPNPVVALLFSVCSMTASVGQRINFAISCSFLLFPFVWITSSVGGVIFSPGIPWDFGQHWASLGKVRLCAAHCTKSDPTLGNTLHKIVYDFGQHVAQNLI